MEGTEVQPLFIYIPVIGVVLFVVLVFACGFRSSTEPPSSMFEDENEKRNKRGRRKVGTLPLFVITKSFPQSVTKPR